MSHYQTLAKSQSDYQTDVDLILSSGEKPELVLRTCLTPYALWKARHNKACSPFISFFKGKAQEAAIVDGEVWVFGLDPTRTEAVVTAAKIAMNYFDANAITLLQAVYIKDLHAQDTNAMQRQAQMVAHKKYYQSVCLAVLGAVQQLDCTHKPGFWVFGAEASNMDMGVVRTHNYRANHGDSVEHLKTKMHLTELHV